MRCYLMRNGHIASVEFLIPAPDEALIEQGKAHFRRLAADTSVDGFEIWDGARKVHVYPPDIDQAPTSPSQLSK